MMRKPTLWAMALVFVVAVIAACGGGAGSVVAPTAPDCTLEFNGDSIGVGPTLASPPLAALHELQPLWSITDKALVGLTLNALANGYATAYVGGPEPSFGVQLPFAQLHRTAHVVIIELGGNDAYSAYPPEQFEQQLRGVLAQIRAEGRVPIVTGIVQLAAAGVFDQATVDRAAVLNDITHRIALDTGTVHAGWDVVAWAGPSETIDGIHRTQPASDRLVAQLAKTLAIVAPLCATSVKSKSASVAIDRKEALL